MRLTGTRIEAQEHVLRNLLRFMGRETERQYVVINVVTRLPKELLYLVV